MRHSILRTVAAGFAGGAALNLSMVLTFRLLGFGWAGGGILLDPSRQSPKLIAVWTKLEPLPLVVTQPALIGAGLLLFGIGHAAIYRWLSPGWPPRLRPRGLRLAALVYGLSFLFWEFFTPFNQFGEPIALLCLELSFWALIALADGFAIAAVMEWRRASRGDASPPPNNGMEPAR